jgi:HlyD family secretion protein
MLRLLERPPTRQREAFPAHLDARSIPAKKAQTRWLKRALPGLALIVILLVGAGYVVWQQQRADTEVPLGFARTNGRIEAERVNVATKYAGRLKEVLATEGDAVTAGQVLARMDTAELEAQLREAEAGVRQSEQQLDQAIALLAQRRSELTLADQQLSRSLQLVEKGITTRETVDQRRAAKLTAEAAVRNASAQITLAKAMIESATAKVERIKTELDDAVLRAPRAGRVQYRLALPGEVLAGGGKVLTLLDLTDVYMTIFLPTKDAGRLALGSEARIIFDAAPQYVVPAYVSFVAADAQFTPKYVETQSEREKLMFRVKVQIPPEILEKYAALVKTGVPGVAYVKVSRQATWPLRLEVRLPE